jgi:hypothetical protein
MQASFSNARLWLWSRDVHRSEGVMKKLFAIACMLLLGACAKSEDCASPEARDKIVESMKTQIPPNYENVPDKYEVQDIKTEKIDKELKTTFCSANVELYKFGSRGVTFAKPVTWKVPVTYTVVQSSEGSLHVQGKTAR